MISGYILQQEQLINVFVLIDIRHDPQQIDNEFIDWLGEHEIPFLSYSQKPINWDPSKQNKTRLIGCKDE